MSLKQTLFLFCFLLLLLVFLVFRKVRVDSLEFLIVCAVIILFVRLLFF